MQKLRCNNSPLRLALFLTGLFLSLAVYSPGYCLDPPVVTPIDEFFIEHNGGPVQIAPPDWQLIVDGLVERPLALTIEEILEFPTQAYMATIECGGNPWAFKVADLIGNAIWTGVPLSTILNQAGPLDDAAGVIFTCLDGYEVRLSLEEIYARDDIMLAHGMNGETLPPEQGHPLRLTMPGKTGNAWAQWVTSIEVTSDDFGVPWSIPLHCQIFTPEHEQTIGLGSQRIYGMALAGDEEIVAVEVSTDGGVSWLPARILTEHVPNVWRHWEIDWVPLETGNHTITARATDISGTVQAEDSWYGWEMFSIQTTVENTEGCVDGTPCEEDTYCDEFTERCVECLIDEHCDDSYTCENKICTPQCTLTITHKKLLAKKLLKPKKRRLKITGGENFDPYGSIDLGPLEALKTKINTKKNILKIKALLPAELEPQIIPISVGDCVGEIEIL
jgi:DMSO/TMAO reductase YedYZ molybdopterin-dependent catalytic subunit